MPTVLFTDAKVLATVGNFAGVCVRVRPTMVICLAWFVSVYLDMLMGFDTVAFSVTYISLLIRLLVCLF